MKKLIYIGVGIFLTVLALPKVAVWGFYLAKVRPEIESIRNKKDSIFATYLEDQRLLGKEMVFLPGPRTRDAGEVLNLHISWGSGDAKQSLVSEGVKAQLMEQGPGYLDHPSEIKIENSKIELLSELNAYDHWNLFRAAPVTNFFKKSKVLSTDGIELPLPNVGELVHLARLRWVVAARNGDEDQALRENRQLAKLLLSTQTLGESIAGITILLWEVHFHEQREQGKVLPYKKLLWSPLVQRETLLRAKRYYLATGGLFNPMYSKETIRGVFEPEQRTLAICAGLWEGVTNTSMLKHYLLPDGLLERNYSDRFAALNDAIQYNAQNCDLPFLRKIWEGGPPGELRKTASLSNGSPTWARFAKYAFIRKTIGEILSTIGAPFFLKGYEKRQNPH